MSWVVIEQARLEGVERFVENFSLTGVERRVKDLVIEKINSFINSIDPRNKAVFNLLNKIKYDALIKDSPQKLDLLRTLGLLDINEWLPSGHTLLHYAIIYKAERAVDFILFHPDFDLNRKDIGGQTIVEEMRKSGPPGMADYLEQKTDKAKSKITNWYVFER
jgi:hypothetical protein